MPNATIKLRSDLVFSHQSGPEGQSFVVKDPATGRFFRFRELEGFLIQQLDGTTSLEVLRTRIQEKLDADLPLPALEQFVTKLRGLSLLETDAVRPLLEAKPRRRIQGNPFYLRWRAIDPDRFLNHLISRTRFFFTPSFLFCAAAVISLAGLITFSNWGEIRHDFQRLYSFQSLLLAYATMLVV